MSTIYVSVPNELKEKLFRFRADELGKGKLRSEKDIIIGLINLLDNPKFRDILSKKLEGSKDGK